MSVEIYHCVLFCNSPSEIDECTSGAHTCHARAICNNTVGSFTCQCMNGWSGNRVCIGKTNRFSKYIFLFVHLWVLACVRVRARVRAHVRQWVCFCMCTHILWYTGLLCLYVSLYVCERENRDRECGREREREREEWEREMRIEGARGRGEGERKLCMWVHLCVIFLFIMLHYWFHCHAFWNVGAQACMLILCCFRCVATTTSGVLNRYLCLGWHTSTASVDELHRHTQIITGTSNITTYHHISPHITTCHHMIYELMLSQCAFYQQSSSAWFSIVKDCILTCFNCQSTVS